MAERRIAVRGIIFHNGKLFAQKFIKNNKDLLHWSTPGGGLESYESLRDALHREMIEETGIAPEIGKLLFIQQYAERRREYLEFFFHIKNGKDYSTVDLASTSHGLHEVADCKFIEPAREKILPVFLRTANFKDAIASSGPVPLYSYL